MTRHNLSSAFSRALRRLFHGALNRRARRARRRSRTSSRIALEHLESRELLSSYIVEDLGVVTADPNSSGSVTAINAKGEVVGIVKEGIGRLHSFLWEPGKPAQDLGSLVGANGSSGAFGSNILGEIVGMSDS